MDRGSLRALRVFTNVGYTLGFLPYKFQVLSHDQQVEDANSIELEIAPLSKPKSGFGDERDEKKGEHVVKRDDKKGRFHTIKKIRIVQDRNKVRKTGNNEKREDFDTRWKFQEGTKTRWWLLVFSMSLQFVYVCFLIFRSIEMFFDDEAPSKNKMQIYYLTGTLMLISFFQILLIKEYDHIHVCLNAVRDTVAHIRINEPVNGSADGGNKRSVKVFCYSALALGIFVPMVRSSNVFRKPGSKLVVTSLADDPTSLPLWLRVAAAAFHFHVAGFSAFASWFLGLTLPWYVASILPVIKQRRPDAASASAQDFIYKSFNMLSVLQTHFSEVYGNVALAMEIGCVYIVVFNIFLAVVHGNFSGLVRALIVYYLQNNFFSRLGEIHTASSGAIEMWKEQNSSDRNHWFTKFQRSVRPLRIYIGSFLSVDKSFNLTLTGIILDQSVNLILSNE